MGLEKHTGQLPETQGVSRIRGLQFENQDEQVAPVGRPPGVIGGESKWDMGREGSECPRGLTKSRR